MSQRTITIVELISIGIVLIGLIFLYQTINPSLHGWSLWLMLIGTVVFAIVSPRKGMVERLAIGLIAFGLISLCQPLSIYLYRSGLQVLLDGTVAFIIVAHR